MRGNHLAYSSFSFFIQATHGQNRRSAEIIRFKYTLSVFSQRVKTFIFFLLASQDNFEIWEQPIVAAKRQEKQIGIVIAGCMIEKIAQTRGDDLVC